MVARQRDLHFKLLTGALDLTVTGCCWLLAYAMRWSTGFLPPVEDESPPIWACTRLLPLVLVLAYTSYRFVGLYDPSRRQQFWREIRQLAQANTLLLLLLLAASFYVQNTYQSRTVSLLFWLMNFLGLVLVRRALRMAQIFRWRSGDGLSRALIVGTGRLARQLDASLRQHTWLGIQPMGFVDVGQEADENVPRSVGKVDDLLDLVDRYEIEHVFLALPLDKYAEARRVLRLLAHTLIDVRLIPDLPRLAFMSLEAQELDGMPMLNLRAPPHGIGDRAVKRAMDVILSAVGLALISPLLIGIAAIIKFSDRGPIFYLQERMGLNGHRFTMFKFRSMRVDAEAGTGPVWAKEGDDRRTRFGTFLRTTSLDELPQLFNVLIGDMSLVGPRPERPFFINHFRRSIPRYMLRHTVKAGITGWAQVNGWRGNTCLRKRVQYDLYYISNWSVWLDLRILYLTIVKAMWDKNAY